MAEQPTDVIQEEVPMAPISDEVWRMILDRRQMLESMIHLMKGEVWVKYWDEDIGDWKGAWKQQSEELMNSKGIRFFSTFLYSAITPDKLMTRISEDETKDRCCAMTEQIILVICERGKEFGIRAANRSFLLRLMDDYYFMALSGSRKGTLLDVLKPTYRRDEQYRPMEKTKKRFGLF